MNIGLAQEAARALHAPGFETLPGYCLRWVRQVVQSYYGHDFWKVPQGLDARQSGKWLLADGDAVPGHGLGEIGSILFFEGEHHGKHGHVVIRLAGNIVAENSVVHAPDGRGIRPLRLLGEPFACWTLPRR
jgi:hypothetical protein